MQYPGLKGAILFVRDNLFAEVLCLQCRRQGAEPSRSYSEQAPIAPGRPVQKAVWQTGRPISQARSPQNHQD
jgi:hypothetical protein